MENSQRVRDSMTVPDVRRLNQFENEAQQLPELQAAQPRGIPIQKVQRTIPKEYDSKEGPKKYSEPNSKHKDELEYDRSGKDQGIVIIFNQVEFPDKEPRRGTTKDVNDLIFTLGRLGYNIDDKYIFSNFSSIQIWDKIEEISKEDLSDRNSLILFFLTHGDEKDTIMTADGSINTKQIWGVLGNHKDLSEKPKLFVFQACKGGSISKPFDNNSPASAHHDISYISLSSSSLHPDMLLCYSATEGMQSYRHVEKGSWFIQEICRNFLMYGRRDDVVSLFTRVAKCVATYTYKETKQMPVLVSTLSKKFYLSMSRDRINKLAIKELFSKIGDNINELHAAVEKIEHDGRHDKS